MDDEAKQWITAALVFLSGAATLATQMLAVAPDTAKVLLFGAALIDLALTVFFGRAALVERRASKAGK